MLRSLPPSRAVGILLVASSVWLAVPGFRLVAQQAAGYNVSGTILDAITRQPVARALVQVGSGDAVLTDNNGKFEFGNVQFAYERITVRRPGYISNQGSPGLQPSQDQLSIFDFQVGPDMPPLSFMLTPEAIVTGRIAMTDSDVADGTRVTAYRKTIETGRTEWQMAGVATTNSDGIFRIASLSPGNYLLYAQPEANLSYVVPDNSTSSGYAPAYYPDVAEPAAAGIVTVSAGEHKAADFALTRRTFYPVTFRVANGRPGYFNNFQIQDTGGADAGVPITSDPAQQIAHAHLPPGRYLLSVRALSLDNKGAPLVGRREFTVSASSGTYVSISVVPLGSVPVTVRKEFTATSTSTVSHVGIGLDLYSRSPFNPGVNISLIDTGNQFSGGGSSAAGLERVPGSNDETSYQIRNVPPGKYWVQADAVGSYISSITSGGVDLTRDVLSVGDGGSSAPIEITLRNDSGSIDGKIDTASLADREKHSTWICVIPLFPTASALSSVEASSTGNFTFDSLAPGAYRVIAFDSRRQIEFHNPEAVAALSGAGQAVTVEPGETAHIQLNVEHSP
ncbi:MAG TPA: hypothetical protein VFW25_14055 [Silvibacterium sp.]|nr:hypothetical protein [Silvibacterium sp.]